MSSSLSTPRIVASPWRRGVNDLRQGLQASDLWLFMGWQDIRQRYRRTVLGPWWVAISTGMLILALGYLWSEIFQVNVKAFVPYFAVGLVLWNFLSGAINEGCTGFIQFEGLIKQQRLPLSALLYRIGTRHLIALGHNAVIVAMIVLWSRPAISEAALLAIPALAVFLVTVFLALVPFAIFCTRFRDLPQMVASLMQVIFFAMPILWRPEALKQIRWVVDYNPLAHLIDIVRNPLLGIPTAWQSWAWSLGLLVLSFISAAYLLGRYGRRVPYWL